MVTTVTMGTTMKNVGALSGLAPFSMRARTPRTSLMAPTRTAVTMKKDEVIVDTVATAALPLMAAGAARPTPTIARAKAGRSWPNELLRAQSNSPFVSTRPQKSHQPERPPTDGEEEDEGGRNRISTTDHSPGTNTRPRMKPT